MYLAYCVCEAYQDFLECVGIFVFFWNFSDRMRLMTYTTVYDVLDHGEVELLESMASDLSVVNAAKVSFANMKKKWMKNQLG